MDPIRQIDWSTWRYGVCRSMRPVSIRHRFTIFKVTEGYVVNDHQVHEKVSVKTFALAKAWAGVRVNEQCVRH